MKISVLMSVYNKETPSFFDNALESLYFQTKKADEVVLVEDGPLTEELYSIIEKWREKLFVKSVRLENNGGLGIALQKGLKNCSYGIVARVDTDDINKKDRFEKQIAFLEKNMNVDIIGSWISEFEEEENNIYAYRHLPISYTEINKFAKKRNPLNHMTVMFKKQSVIDVGGYKSFLGFEDFYLWARMLNNNAIFANIPEVLVNVRGGTAMLARRQGFNYAKNEYLFQKELYKIKFLSKMELVRNILYRIPIRLSPRFVIKIIYKYILRNK